MPWPMSTPCTLNKASRTAQLNVQEPHQSGTKGSSIKKFFMVPTYLKDVGDQKSGLTRYGGMKLFTGIYLFDGKMDCMNGWMMDGLNRFLFQWHFICF